MPAERVVSFLASGRLVAGLSLLSLLTMLALVSPWLPSDPGDFDLDHILEPPGRKHWLGTDTGGRDLAARIASGARVSLGVGLVSTLVSLCLAVPLGALAGYRRGWTDAAISRWLEAGICVPVLLLLLALLSVAPVWFSSVPEVWRLGVVLGIGSFVPAARFVRADVLRIAVTERVVSARAVGCAATRIVLVHILPSALGPVAVTAAFGIGTAVALEAALSFLGLGIQPPATSWGGLLGEAREVLDRAWWLALFPGLSLFALVLACNLIGEGLRERLDPRLRSWS